MRLCALALCLAAVEKLLQKLMVQLRLLLMSKVQKWVVMHARLRLHLKAHKGD